MPSKVQKFQFRFPSMRKKLNILGIDGDRLAKQLMEHASQSIDNGVCPICNKSFDDCKYFQGIKND